MCQSWKFAIWIAKASFFYLVLFVEFAVFLLSLSVPIYRVLCVCVIWTMVHYVMSSAHKMGAYIEQAPTFHWVRIWESTESVARWSIVPVLHWGPMWGNNCLVPFKLVLLTKSRCWTWSAGRLWFPHDTESIATRPTGRCNIWRVPRCFWNWFEVKRTVLHTNYYHSSRDWNTTFLLLLKC